MENCLVKKFMASIDNSNLPTFYLEDTVTKVANSAINGNAGSIIPTINNYVRTNNVYPVANLYDIEGEIPNQIVYYENANAAHEIDGGWFISPSVEISPTREAFLAAVANAPANALYMAFNWNYSSTEEAEQKALVATKLKWYNELDE